MNLIVIHALKGDSQVVYSQFQIMTKSGKAANPMSPRFTIISGGQTGADRAALDAAIASGTPCSGWCPRGRLAEDGPIAGHYPLKELDGGYLERTERNVVDSDGTVVITIGPADGGSRRTIQFCQKHRRPYLHIDADALTTEQAGLAIADFVKALRGHRLNVAGSRASKAPSLYAYVRKVVDLAIRALSDH